MSEKPKSKLPSPQERPDLYDDFDGIDRPEGWKNPVKVKISPALEKRIAEMKAKRAAR